jgi:hypothetical protein
MTPLLLLKGQAVGQSTCPGLGGSREVLGKDLLLMELLRCSDVS